MKVISYNSRIKNPQEQNISTFDRELLGIVTYPSIFLIPHYWIPTSDTHLHKKKNFSPRFYRAQTQQKNSLNLE